MNATLREQSSSVSLLSKTKLAIWDTHLFSIFHLDCLAVCPSGAAVVLYNLPADVKLISHRDSHSFWTKMDNNVTTDADKDKQVTLPARVWTLPPPGAEVKEWSSTPPTRPQSCCIVKTLTWNYEYCRFKSVNIIVMMNKDNTMTTFDS